MQKTLYIPIDTTLDNTVECEKLIKRGDTLILKLKVFTNGALANLTGQSINLILKKADNTLIEKTITSVVNGVVTATLDVQATVVAGIVSGEIQIYTTDTLASTNTFTFNVTSSLADDVLEISKNDIQVLSDLKNFISEGEATIAQYENSVLAIGNSVEAVEALANIKLYIDTNLPILESENAKAVVNIANEKVENNRADINIVTLGELNNNAEVLQQLLSNLTEENNEATTNINGLTTQNTNATNNISSLDEKNSTATTNIADLEAKNTKAEANIEALEQLGDVTQIAQDVTNLKNEIETARGTDTNLDARLDKFDTSLSDIVFRPNIKIIGHRGASGIYPENTLPSYELAGELGFWGGECDISTTNDGKWILMHDDTYDRTTTGTGNINTKTYAEVQNMIIDSGNNINLFPNLKVPTLEEYLLICKKVGLTPIIEIKDSCDVNCLSLLVSTIEYYGFTNTCIIISFGLTILQTIRNLNSLIRLQYIVNIVDETTINSAKLINADIDANYNNVTQSIVDMVHHSKLKINVWTVDDYTAYTNLINWGVDFITTNSILGVNNND